MKLQNEETLLRGTCTRHRVQSLHPPNATNSTRQGRHTAAMRAVATVAVSACFFYLCQLHRHSFRRHRRQQGLDAAMLPTGLGGGVE